MIFRRRFHFRPVLTLLTAVGIGVLISLGNWQLDRRAWKLELIDKIEARIDAVPLPFAEAVARAEAGEDMEYTPVTLVGIWRPMSEAKVFGSFKGAAGVYLFAPIRALGGEHVYVNLGYLPQPMSRAESHAQLYLTIDESVVDGLFRYKEEPSPPASWFRSAEQSPDGLWFVRDPSRFAVTAGIEASSYYIDQVSVEGRDWPKGGTTRLEFRNKHLEYALTWFGLAVTLLAVWLAYCLSRRDA